MINWKELEKFITPGKVCTLVMLIDGKEIGAFSFNIETLAYKEAFETKEPEPVKVADKKIIATEIKKAETERKESLKAKKATKPEPEPMDDDQDDDNEPEVDEETGEIKPTLEQVEQFEESKQPDHKEPEPEKKLTRAEIMAQSEPPVVETKQVHVPQRGSSSSGPTIPAEVRANEHSGSKSTTHIDEGPHPEEKKVVEQTFGEEW